MRLPRVLLEEVRGERPAYSADLVVELWPGLRQEMRLKYLSRCPDGAACTRLERVGSDSTYVITLYSSGQPFASLYLVPLWALIEHGTHSRSPYQRGRWESSQAAGL